MCAGEKAATAVMPIVQRSVWRGAILCFPNSSGVVLALSIAKNIVLRA